MTITSTEFQQNVGYYLKEAEKGKTIQINKQKPTKAIFDLKLASKKDTAVTSPSRKELVLKLIKELNIKGRKESGLEFQHRVRS
ncbi:MAG: hypothetical protein WCJ58_06685 [bacterium]